MMKHKLKIRQYLSQKSSELSKYSFEKCRIRSNKKMIFLSAILVLFYLQTINASCSSGSKVRWRSDGRCGASFPLFTTDLGSTISECDPNSDRPCCSDYGYCGNSASHCMCTSCVDYRNIMREPSCYFLFEGKTGYLESPNYPKPYPSGRDCCYDIMRTAPEVCGVVLTVEDLDVGFGEDGGFCKTDWLSLPSCVPERGTRICGNSTGGIYEYLFQPGASAMRFTFHSLQNLNKRHRGFRIRYDLKTSCTRPYQTQKLPISEIPGASGKPCYTRITDRRGTINTPYHPQPYPSNLDCIYEFVRTKSNICGVKMKTDNFYVEDPFTTVFGGACSDFFHLPSCGFICGKTSFNWIVEFQPGARSLKFHFHTDEAVGQSGFLINFEQVTDC